MVHGKKSAMRLKETQEMWDIPGLGISPGVENGNPLQYSCLDTPMDRGAHWATVHEVAKVGYN